MTEHPEMECDNEFCIHHAANHYGQISSWNKTKCDFWEIDPYHITNNRTGIRIDTCAARIRYKKMIDW